MSASVATFPSDFELLGRFVERKDQSAFTAIVRRHGGMVRGVAHRVLGDPAGADDAFQATFISLSRHALSLTQTEQTHDSLSSWLYRVAHNSALQIKRKAKSRRRCETTFAEHKQVEEREKESRDEWLPILDEEIGQLPTRFQSPLVLCHLEGRTQQDAADELGLTYATIRRRLQQAKRLLRERLVNRGMSDTGALLAVPLLVRAAELSAAPSASVIQQTISAAMSQSASTPVATAAAVGGQSLLAKAVGVMSSGKSMMACGLTLIGGLSAGLLASNFDWSTVQDGISARTAPAPDLDPINDEHAKIIAANDASPTPEATPLESFSDQFVTTELGQNPLELISANDREAVEKPYLAAASEVPELQPIEIDDEKLDDQIVNTNQPPLDLQEPVQPASNESPETSKTKANVIRNVVTVLEDQKRRLHEDQSNSATTRRQVPPAEKVFKGVIVFGAKTHRFYTPDEADKLLERLIQQPAPSEDVEFRAVFHIDGVDHAATDFGQTLDILQRKQFVR
ncbi:RNA polymerase sigma factor [Thalassoroseus pseudoceratinae]|uniref:RNA polymerase sigma factor n=1 Tax=Thalassoroseus pseudoceratinae TaxID=2713176 RepID=UPI001420C46E|nr:sigma-70 family RNA polymerase sigma factor [Thalassoroseus pseudoceratinae]